MPLSYDTYRVRAFIPKELEPLAELAYNLHWTWDHDAIELFHRLDRDLWNETGHNPVKMLGVIKQDKLAKAIQDDGFMDQLQRSCRTLKENLTGRSWFEDKHGKFDSPKIAYFSMEFGLNECLPIYSGGLGILAGDHLKSASELGLPLVGMGLLYQQGYFQQYLNADGWQQEKYVDNDFYNLPVKLEVGPDGDPLLVEIPFPGCTVCAQIWRAQVGRIPLYLLDTNIPQNQPDDRGITAQLYGGDEENRIKQELVLGVGGMIALRTLGLHVNVCHMNEGHAAFMALERIRHRKHNDGLSTDQALEVVKSGTFFTTHTPVPAGIDVFSSSLIEKYLRPILADSDIGLQEFMALGRKNPDDPTESFNMALLALRTTASANGVSRLHGEVSRKMFRSIWPETPLDEVPIGHVTNGIHTRSWTSSEMTALLRRYLGPDWLRKPADQTIWQRVERIPDVELWRAHERRRERLIAFTRRRLATQLQRRGANTADIESASEVLNPEALTIGFARRFATYKRATLLLRDPERLKKLLTDQERPVQFIFAGKAHPRDNAGKNLIKELIHFVRDESIRDHFVFIENYDINVARYLVEGVDVWMNNPCRPMEASGTSGMKVVPNGGLNLSVLDGWWCEGYAHDTGWAIGSGEDYDNRELQDEVESKALFDVLENDLIPVFYDRRANKPPRRWIAMMKSSMRKLGPAFSTNRMVQEYTDKFYMNAYHNWKRLSADDFALAKQLVQWKQHIESGWDQVEIVKAWVESEHAEVGSAMKAAAWVRLGALSPEDVRVQIYSGALDKDRKVLQGCVEEMKFVDRTDDGLCHYEAYVGCDESGLFGYSTRIMPNHPNMVDHFGLEKMRWIGDRTQSTQTSAAPCCDSVGVC
ncbi:MAG: alpha-glucan family phosphorylase [bacterium]